MFQSLKVKLVLQLSIPSNVDVVLQAIVLIPVVGEGVRHGSGSDHQVCPLSQPPW